MTRPSWMETIEYTFDGLFETGGNISLAFFRRLAPFLVPAAPAFFFAFALYTAVLQTAGQDHTVVAATVGVIGALALITTGLLASHTAVTLLALGETAGAIVAGLFVVMYLVVEIGGILKLGTLTEDGRIAGVSISLITGAVYVTLSLMDYARLRQRARQAAEEKQQAAEDAAVQRQGESEEADKQRQHERDMAQMQHSQQMERDKLAAQERLELARIQAKSSGVIRQDAGQNAQQDVSMLPSDWRQLTRQQKRDLARATREQRENMMPDLATRTRREWHRRLDEIAAQNGNYVEVT